MQTQVIQQKIYEVRGQKIMLDYDLAELYEVETRILNQAVKRNMDLFPEDFMFQLTREEWKQMSSQFVMTFAKYRNIKHWPLVFTEHGVTMLASVLKSKKARETSVLIVRVFISLKQFLQNYKEMDEKLQELESRYNRQFRDVYEAINYLLQKDKQETEHEQRKGSAFVKMNKAITICDRLHLNK